MRDVTDKTRAAVKVLEDAGAEYGRRDDGHGFIRTGWWLDGVFLARASITAVNLMKGN